MSPQYLAHLSTYYAHYFFVVVVVKFMYSIGSVELILFIRNALCSWTHTSHIFSSKNVHMPEDGTHFGKKN